MLLEPVRWIPRSLPSRSERLLIHPRFANALQAAGLTTVESFLALDGPIISGHPDRHVLRTQVGSIACLLKREHRVPQRDRLSSFLHGYGFVSVSLREAMTLETLRGLDIPVPEWLAAGEANGQAFVLIKECASTTELRRLLQDRRLPAPEQRRVARRLARVVAKIHNHGIDYPDCYAKHVLIDPSGDFTLIDWQRSRRRRAINWRQRCRDLAALHASLSDELVDANSRLAFLLAYWRAANDRSVSTERVCALIQRRAQVLLKRGSLREQRLPTVRESQPLYWVRGEEICLTAEGRERLDVDSLSPLIAIDSTSPPGEMRSTIQVGATELLLIRRRTVRRLEHIWDRLRGRRWQSPECRTAAELLRRERLGEPRRLLAFGQCERSPGVVDSFLVQLPENAT